MRSNDGKRPPRSLKAELSVSCAEDPNRIPSMPLADSDAGNLREYF
jgi:hypothetical protein